MDHDPSYLAELGEDECLDLLTSSTVGRLAFVDGDGQQMLPVNYVVVDGAIRFRTSESSTLAGLAEGHDDVVFGVDHHDDLFQTGWNVTAHGATRRAEAADGDAAPEPWAPGEREVLVELSVARISGRKVRWR